MYGQRVSIPGDGILAGGVFHTDGGHLRAGPVHQAEAIRSLLRSLFAAVCKQQGGAQKQQEQRHTAAQDNQRFLHHLCLRVSQTTRPNTSMSAGMTAMNTMPIVSAAA